MDYITFGRPMVRLFSPLHTARKIRKDLGSGGAAKNPRRHKDGDVFNFFSFDCDGGEQTNKA